MARIIEIIAVLLAFGASNAALAQDGGQGEIPRGLWQTEADMLGTVLLVRTRGCGRDLCGRVERAKNPAGYDAPSKAVGQKALIKMKPQPDGSFFGVYRDAKSRIYKDSRVTVLGREIRLRACDDEGCKERVWKRVK